MNIQDFSAVQLRCVNKLLLSGNLRTDVLASSCRATPSDVAYQMLQLRSAGLVSSYNDGQSYVVWSLLPKMRDMLEQDAQDKLRISKTPTTFKVFGPTNSRYIPATYAKESDAIKEATQRAKQEPGQDIQIFALHKTVKWEPPVAPEGKLIIN